MNELHLFAGIGGGILGSMLCGHRIVCAVELDPYCRSVLIRRQNDGHLMPFPIWDDVRTFDGRRWRGIADVVSGGFPCQNISPAGDRAGITGEKSCLWFNMLRIIREVRPQYVFVENSGQLIRRGLDAVLGGLDGSGYDAEWCVLGASDVGAPHIRKRCWILGKISDSAGNRLEAAGSQQQATRLAGVCVEISDSCCDGRDMRRIGFHADVKKSDERQCNHGRGTPEYGTRKWWEVEPGIRRVVDGCPHRLERLKGLGNAQVPLCAAVAWKTLYERINE